MKRTPHLLQYSLLLKKNRSKPKGNKSAAPTKTQGLALSRPMSVDSQTGQLLYDSLMIDVALGLGYGVQSQMFSMQEGCACLKYKWLLLEVM